MDSKIKQPTIDFSNLSIAFKRKSDKELKRASFLFRIMSQEWLVNISTTMGLLALKLHLPLTKTIIEATIFKQFIGGTSLEKCVSTIAKLELNNTATILDYGAEAKDTEADFIKTQEENLEAIHFAKAKKSVPIITVKVSGFARNELLERIQEGLSLNPIEQVEYDALIEKIEAICTAGEKDGVAIFIDAEESWIQNTIDQIATKMMQQYNRKKVIVYNTFQMYRKDRYAYLVNSYEESTQGNYLLGAKLVRGAYMEKERLRATDKGYPSPIQDTKEATDADFNKALTFCFDHYEQIGFCNATHNENSCQLLAQLIAEKQLEKQHPHFLFAQLYGMSDHITFNLSHAGYKAAKYVPYGSIDDVFPYLVRRAQENTAMQGEISREYNMIAKELLRRK